MIRIFFSYSHEDEELMNEVRRQLIVYEREGYIFKWFDRDIQAGEEWKKSIDQRLKEADIILLFMSPRFIESKYCYEVEGNEALEQHNSKQSVVIPIILRPCAWDDSPFGKLQALPKDGKPVTQWSNIDEATLNIARGIKLVVDKLQSKHPSRASKPKKTESEENTKDISDQDIKTLNVFMEYVPFTKLLGYIYHLPNSIDLNFLDIDTTLDNLKLDLPHCYPFDSEKLNIKFSDFMQAYANLKSFITGYWNETAIFGQVPDGYLEKGIYIVSLNKKYLSFEETNEIIKEIEKYKSEFIVAYNELMMFLRKNYAGVILDSYKERS